MQSLAIRFDESKFPLKFSCYHNNKLIKSTTIRPNFYIIEVIELNYNLYANKTLTLKIEDGGN